MKKKIKKAIVFILLFVLYFYRTLCLSKGLISINFIILFDIFLLYIAYIVVKRSIYLDQKTKTYNVLKFKKDLKKRGKKNKKFMLCFIDITCFKKINDQFGHDVGDNVLFYISNNIKDISNSDIYRYGGDEFIVLIYKDFDENLKKINEINGFSINSSTKIYFSIGTSEYLVDSCNSEELLIIADKRMYHHKEEQHQNCI